MRRPANTGVEWLLVLAFHERLARVRDGRADGRSGRCFAFPLSPALVISVLVAPAEVEALADRCARAQRIAVDVEADGLFAFRARLCVMQVAFVEGDSIEVAIIDALETSPKPLANVLGPNGPEKVLHDLTFDARMLDAAGTPLACARDTSVAARLLGIEKGGLASLLESELGVHVDKRYQQHDWSERPLRPEHVAYLAGDVAHLLALDDALSAKAAALDLEPEIAEECAHKLASALLPPRDARPEYTRIKGAEKLDALGRAVLRRLVEVRTRAAEEADVPPFKVAGNEVLLELAARRPASQKDASVVRGAMAGRAGRNLGRFLEAIRAGTRDGEIPAEDRACFEKPKIDRAAIAQRKAREQRVMAFRKREAKSRGLDEQAILPGHCASDLVDALLEPDADAVRAKIRGIPGIGARRLARYEDEGVAMATATEPAT